MSEPQAVSIWVDIVADDFTTCHRCRQLAPSSWFAGRDAKHQPICEDCVLAEIAESYFGDPAGDWEGGES